MIVKNQYFFLSLLLIVIQQSLVGLSTYFIGLAGKFAYLDPKKSFFYIVAFFISIAICYIFGSSSLYFRVKLSNSTWSHYYKDTLANVKNNWGVNSHKNKEIVTNWLVGESLPTIEEASFYYIEIIALYLNVIFTVVALYAVLGSMITISIISCMAASLLLIYITKNKVKELSSDIQSSKINTFIAINKIWDNAFFGMKRHFEESLINAKDKEGVYFSNLLKYKFIEQIVACSPVIASIPFIIYASYNTVIAHPYMMGSLVAVLPRSLQLYQSIHAASMHTTQLMIIKGKINNLEMFSSTLESVSFCDKFTNIKISCDNQSNEISILEFLERLFSNNFKPARYTITGPNGSGKSTFLKKIKSQLHNAILVNHENNIGVNDKSGSSGERMISLLEDLFSDDSVKFFLLDEWDANTDSTNTESLDNIIQRLSKKAIVVEVRHKIIF